ncbi:MAG: class I SAM-dependent methyltransferase [Candidatus Sericytochromatia bacterium]
MSTDLNIDLEDSRRFEETISELALYKRKTEEEIIDKIKNSMTERNIEWEEYSKNSIIDFHRLTEYNLYCLAKWNSEKKYQDTINYISYIIKKNSGNVLDFGGGIGTLTILLKNQGNSTDFMEVPSETLNYATWRFKRRFLDLNIYTTLNQIKITYNNIVALDVLEVLEKPLAHLKKFYDLLDSNGLLIFSIGDTNSKSHPMNLSRNTEFFNNIDEYCKEIGFIDSKYHNKFNLKIKKKP